MEPGYGGCYEKLKRADSVIIVDAITKKSSLIATARTTIAVIVGTLWRVLQKLKRAGSDMVIDAGYQPFIF